MTSVFAASTKVLFLERRLGTTLCLHPFFRFFLFFLFLQILNLKAFGNLRNNSRTRIFVLDIRYHFLCVSFSSSVPFLVPALISRNFQDTKMINGFRLSHYIELNSTSAKQMFLGWQNNISEYNLYFPIPETQMFSLG